MLPNSNPLASLGLLRQHLALGTAAAGLVMAAGAGGNEAAAGTCTPLVGANIVCSGAADAGGNDMTQVLSGGGGPVSVTTADGFGIDTSTGGGDALTITGDGGLTFDDTNIDGSAITGAENGIYATNGGGALTITTNGTVTGIAGSGMYARINTGTDLTISAAAASGNDYGIYGVNFGTGDLAITTSGVVTAAGIGLAGFNSSSGAASITASEAVTGNGYAGIILINRPGTSTLTVSAAAVSGGSRGISALNYGTGDLSISTTGQVTGLATAGIAARNYYGGSVNITATDLVSASSGKGIYALNDSDGTSLTVSAAGVTGGSFGVYAYNQGTGDLSITTSGVVTGGSAEGIYARNSNGGGVSISAADSVSGQGDAGIYARNDNDGTSLSVSAAGVSGGGHGIYALNYGSGDVSVSTTGQVTGATKIGIAAYAVGHGGGMLTVTANDAVSGAGLAGIRAASGSGAGSITVSSIAVNGGVFGIDAAHQGSGDLGITATGPVVGGGNGSGIRATNYNGGALTIAATDVSGGQNGIQVDNQASSDLLVTVSGTVSGGVGAGIANVDSNALGGKIVLTDTATATSDAGVAVTDGNGDTILNSKGALAGQVQMNGGDDVVNLLAGSATGVINMGQGQDDIRIFGANAGGGWVDPDFSGTFDNNEGQVLQLDGGVGFDVVSLFGVVAAGEALGTGTSIEALALLDQTVLQANTIDLSSFGILVIGPGSNLQAEGNSPSETIVGPLVNAGVVDLQDGAANDVVTIDGDYTGGEGSQIWLDFDGNTGTADVIVVNGKIVDHDPIDIGGRTFDTESGPTEIHINAFGRGARPGEADVRLIEVAGEADADDFFLARPVELDIFDYELVFEDGAFVLASDFLDQIYTYENLPGAMQTIGLALTGQLVERVGVRSAVPSTLTDAAGNPVPGGAPVDTALWGRAVGLSLNSEGDLDSFTGSSFEQTIGFLQAGVDVTVLERSSGRLLIGALGHWGTSSLDVSDFDGDAAGGADFDFYGGGLTATWYSTAGWYFDNVFQYTAYDVDISGGARFGTTSTDGYGIAASHELGYRLPIGDAAALVPQAQITYQHIDFDDFTDPDGVRVSLGDGDSLVGRLGVAFENSAAIGSALATGYVEANLLHEFLGDNSVDVARGPFAAAIDQDLGGTSVELGFGGTVAVSRGVSLYAEVDYTIPFDDGLQGVQALGGIRFNLNPPPAPPPPVPVIAPVASTAFIVFFDWDRADLTSEANLVLDDVVVVANQSGYASIRLDGYTDLSGSAAYNLGLSERRANSVANGLIARGIAPDEIVIRAFGEENPLVPTPDGVREPQNRRVEIFLS